MSRNKFILLMIIIAGLYFFLPDEGGYHTFKVNLIAILPYFIMVMMMYLVITINLLKRAWKKLDQNITNENVTSFSKIMNISFDVARMLGEQNLKDLYRKVVFSRDIDSNSQRLIYNAMRRKRIDVAPPTGVK